MYQIEAAGEQCKPSERSVPGKALKGHTFKEFVVKAIVECQNSCENDPRCASYNYYTPNKICELNSQTKEARPDDFVTDDLGFYMKREGTISIFLCLSSLKFFYQTVLLFPYRDSEVELVHTGAGTPYNGLDGEAPPERGTFFRLQVYESVGISLNKVLERVGKSVISVCKIGPMAKRYILWW